ncbi:bacillithiol biosynthesis deacetylase BshB1 [Thermoactinomyces sp. DSM 45892]|uniref:bacillithiol biosynthesis deacetylase BshB1 n=1 Tax=Thermoactinomyces sp. DSM 45892 TaxID=1882753 RepID=UPI00089A8203|nr:bacillithiol biosynthesis deacetylase BshB1 [Thermoactinomyces sp. DSM 45892]SDY98213.1 bacillithiol biosynthesis deacetylase BshB1 [Thermoactinomyces sp. DSM 45892]
MEEFHSVDLLAFGAHPDDVEIGASGILAKHSVAGKRVAICSLTEAELSSNGTVELRREEAKKAGEALGLVGHYNLQLPDRGLTGSPEQLVKMVQVIRQCRPSVILAPYFEDRHPDHVACSKLVNEAIFNAGLKNYQTPDHEPHHRIKQLYYYFLNDIAKADMIVDISNVYEKKMDSILAYRSQFRREEGQVDTPINGPTFLSMIQGRDQMWGQMIGAQYGEGLVSPRPIKQSLLV